MTVSGARVSLGSPLTLLELDIAAQTQLDLSVGYPRVQLPPDLDRLVHGTTRHELEDQFRTEFKYVPDFSTDTLCQIFANTALQFLTLSDTARLSCLVCNSGSIALERTLRALASNRTLMISNPCFDVIPAIGQEIGATVIRTPAARSATCQPTLADLTSSISTHSPAVLLLCSPENPTGAVYSTDDLETISRACAASGTIVVVDHSLISVFHDPDPPTIGHLPPSFQNWVLLWDTGKFLDAGDQKLALIATPRPDIYTQIRTSLSTLQCTVPSYCIILLTLLLTRSLEIGYRKTISDLVRHNFDVLSHSLRTIGLTAVLGHAGPFCLIDVSSTRLSGDAFCAAVLKCASVGLVPGALFFHGCDEMAGTHLVRAGLARNKTVIAESAKRLVSFMRTHFPLV